MEAAFDAYFRAADLDRDGRISGQEAVAFFKGSGLPQPVLAQVPPRSPPPPPTSPNSTLLVSVISAQPPRGPHRELFRLPRDATSRIEQFAAPSRLEPLRFG